MASSSWSTLMRWLGDGVSVNPSPIWTTTNWVELCATTTTRTSWQKCTASATLTNLTSLGWLKPCSPHPRILQLINTSKISWCPPTSTITITTIIHTTRNWTTSTLAHPYPTPHRQLCFPHTPDIGPGAQAPTFTTTFLITTCLLTLAIWPHLWAPTILTTDGKLDDGLWKKHVKLVISQLRIEELLISHLVLPCSWAVLRRARTLPSHCMVKDMFSAKGDKPYIHSSWSPLDWQWFHLQHDDIRPGKLLATWLPAKNDDIQLSLYMWCSGEPSIKAV